MCKNPLFNAICKKWPHLTRVGSQQSMPHVVCIPEILTIISPALHFSSLVSLYFASSQRYSSYEEQGEGGMYWGGKEGGQRGKCKERGRREGKVHLCWLKKDMTGLCYRSRGMREGTLFQEGGSEREKLLWPVVYNEWRWACTQYTHFALWHTLQYILGCL